MHLTFVVVVVFFVSGFFVFFFVLSVCSVDFYSDLCTPLPMNATASRRMTMCTFIYKLKIKTVDYTLTKNMLQTLTFGQHCSPSRLQIGFYPVRRLHASRSHAHVKWQQQTKCNSPRVNARARAKK